MDESKLSELLMLYEKELDQLTDLVATQAELITELSIRLAEYTAVESEEKKDTEG